MKHDHKYLYSPWRLDYILSEKPDTCILCELRDSTQDIDNLILYRSNFSFIMLNRYPYNNAHMMIVPYLHASRLADLPDEVLIDMMRMLKTAEKALYAAYKCDGINMGLNEGKAAGAGIDEHLHWHILPRWNGDSNFMSVVSGERVIPEAFERTFSILSKELNNLLPSNE